jgi:biopolymer transport protein ExbD
VLVDMTPLIDVVFLLLIFFMVSTTFDRQTQLKVDLPKASATVEERQEPRVIEVVVDAAGHFYLDNQELVTHDVATLKQALKRAAGGETDIPVRVTSDRKAPFEAVIMVMDAAGQLGMNRLGFLTRATQPAE